MTARLAVRITVFSLPATLFFSLMLFEAPVAFAQSETPLSEEGVTVDDRDWAAGGRNEASVSIGATGEESDWGPSAGFGYEFRLNRIFGFGGVAEWTGADFRAGMAAVLVRLHPWRGLKLVGAPGFQITMEYEDVEFLMRVGGEYAFDVGYGYEFAPAAYADFTREHVAFIVGGVLAWRF